MMKILFTIFYLVIVFNVNAQTTNFAWVRGIGGTGDAYGISIATDLNGNVYTTGAFRGTNDFDPSASVFNLTSNGDLDVFISKVDASGNFLWAKSIGAIYDDKSYSVATDAMGNVYIGGSFYGTVDFNPDTPIYNLSSGAFIQYGFNAFLLKLDPVGNFIWAKVFTSASFNLIKSLAVDNFGNLLVAGNFTATTDFDADTTVYNLMPEYGSDIFILKLDTVGGIIWAKSLGGAGNESVSGLVLDNLNNIYTTGSFSGISDFYPGIGMYNLSASGVADIFVSKLSSSGSFLWAKRMGGNPTSYSGSASIDVDALGNVYTTGSFTDSVDFDPGPGIFRLKASSVNSTLFISKLNGSGNFVWAKTFTGNGTKFGSGIAVSASGNVYTTGVFVGTVDFDPGFGLFNMTSSSNQSIYISSLDNFGNFIWAKSFDGFIPSPGSGGTANAIAIYGSSSIYTTGAYFGALDFDPDSGLNYLPSINTYFNVFIHKMNTLSLGLFGSEKSTSFELFPNPNTGMFTIQKKLDAFNLLEIYNMNGIKMYQTELKSRKTEINFKARPGIYIVKAGAFKKKIIID